jgi:hypothetical protein
MHRTNARLIKVSDHRLGNPKQKSEMPASNKDALCPPWRKTHIQLPNRSLEGKSVVHLIAYEVME